MTREEIVQSKEYIFAKEACRHGDQDAIQAFEDGAEYGYKFAIEKACELLETNKNHPFIGCEDPCLSGGLTEEFIEWFKKTMEEEE